MDKESFRVDSWMIPPIAIAMIAGIVLVVLEMGTKKGLILPVILAPFYYLAAEILARRISMDEKGITIRKLLRSTRLEWNGIQTVDAVRTGAKVFLILQPWEGRPSFVTNTIRPFKDLVEHVLERIPEGRISSGARLILSDPPSKRGPMVQAWVVCLVLVGCVVGKLAGYG